MQPKHDRSPARSAARRAPILLIAAALGACSGPQPFQTRPQAAPGGSKAEAGTRVGVCYNAMFSTPESVQATAAEACGPDQSPELVGQDMRLACPLLTPTRATYLCKPR
jgi:hypothetical protein